MKPFAVTQVILSLFQFCALISSGTLPQKTSAVFYELPNKDGYKISYREAPLGWSNLQRLFQKRGQDNKPPGLLCITGVWLMYPHPAYKTGNTDTVNVISGQDQCISPSDVGTIGAMQTLTTSAATTDYSITLFSSPNFGSLAHVFSESESQKGGLKQLAEDDEQIGSLIVLGDKPWSLMSTNGKLLCVRPQPSGRIQGLSICYGADMIQIEDFQVNAVFPDCPPEHDSSVVANLRLVDCKQFGSGKAEPLKTLGIMGRTFGTALECKYNITWNSTRFSEEQSALIAKLLTIRLTHDFENTEQTLWPDAREDIWKTGPLDTAFDIMIQTVPGEVVNKHFLMMIREFTVWHLNELWTEQRKQNKIRKRDWRHHKVLVHLLNKCLHHATKNRDHYMDIIKTSYNERRNVTDFSKSIDPSLLYKDKMDPVIDIAYLVSNYAMALCHKLLDYKVNFWDNFVTTFLQLYFSPLHNTRRWLPRKGTPETFLPKTFGVILSGFGIKSQHRRIAFATTRMLELTPKLRQFHRNPRFDEVFKK